MGLMGALVDRGRVVTREAATERIEGTKRFETVRGPWFRCRLAVEGPTAENVEDGRVRAQHAHTLLYWRTDERGGEVVLNADDLVQIRSNQMGDEVWQVSAVPLLIRKRQAMLGAGYVNVLRVEEPPD